MTDSKYIATIGLEIHAELKTNSKMFCSCANNPDEEQPNKNICPICLAHPGTLPVLNFQAIKNVIRMGVAVDGKIADFTEWDRKNYFYPDIPKGYQISQYKFPLVEGGILASVEIERIHLEEDTAQSTHDTHAKSLVNFNRSGVPLMELVTKPVIQDAETAVRFAKELQLLLRYLGAGEANMEKGEMRVEANISVASPSDTANKKFGTKTEVKNLNSFRSVEKAIAYEIERQSSLLEQGGVVKQETRGWDDIKQETYSQRSKESSHDYRYFPDPDIPKLKLSEIDEFKLESIKKDLPELPWIKRQRLTTKYGLTEKETAVFIDSTLIGSYFESVISGFEDDTKKVKLAVNYILTDYLGLLKKHSINIDATDTDHGQLGPIPAKLFSEIINLISSQTISSRGAKDLITLLVEGGASAESSAKELAEKHGLIQKSDAGTLEPIIKDIIANNKKVVDEYKAGKQASLQFLIGQAMKLTKGSANPEAIKKMLLDNLS
jgi:aspartyl-tRNA(Asn)/glutamyl-tRNA(Gln) amidotransferase subunit B